MLILRWTVAPVAGIFRSNLDREAVTAIGSRDKINIYVTGVIQVFQKSGIDIGGNTIRFQLFKTIRRLIQSHAQCGAASAGAHKIQHQKFVSGLVGIQRLFQFSAGHIGNYKHYIFLSSSWLRLIIIKIIKKSSFKTYLIHICQIT